MIEKLEFDSTNARFENLEIGIHKVYVERFSAIENSELPLHTAYSNVWEDINFHYYTNNDISFSGKIYVCLKNQNEKDNTVLFICFNLGVKANNETDKASVFTKTLQYLFMWVENKSNTLNLTDKNGEKFIPPAFAYSRSNFEKHF